MDMDPRYIGTGVAGTPNLPPAPKVADASLSLAGEIRVAEELAVEVQDALFRLGELLRPVIADEVLPTVVQAEAAPPAPIYQPVWDLQHRLRCVIAHLEGLSGAVRV